MNIDSSLKLQFANAGLIAALAASVIVLAFATNLGNAQAHDLGILVLEDQIVAQLETIPEHWLKGHYLRCSYQASQGLYDVGKVAFCSIVQEKLLKRSFGGNFDALQAWSKTQRDDAFMEWFKDSSPLKNY